MTDIEPGSIADGGGRNRPDPAAEGHDRIADLLFQWEIRNLSPAGRAFARVWRQGRRAVSSTVLGCTLFVLGAAVTAAVGSVVGEDPAVDPVPVLEQRLRSAENTVMAREGELALTRLELERLTTIFSHARQHHIPVDLAGSIYDIATAEGVDPALAFSLVRVESGFTGSAVSSAGAVGLTQVMPSTAFWLEPGVTYGELFNRETNLRLGFRYLRLMLEQYNGDLHLALLAYNRGPARVDDILRAGGDPSNGYSRLVTAGARKPSE